MRSFNSFILVSNTTVIFSPAVMIVKVSIQFVYQTNYITVIQYGNDTMINNTDVITSFAMVVENLYLFKHSEHTLYIITFQERIIIINILHNLLVVTAFLVRVKVVYALQPSTRKLYKVLSIHRCIALCYIILIALSFQITVSVLAQSTLYTNHPTYNRMSNYIIINSTFVNTMLVEINNARTYYTFILHAAFATNYHKSEHFMVTKIEVHLYLFIAIVKVVFRADAQRITHSTCYYKASYIAEHTYICMCILLIIAFRLLFVVVCT